MLAVVWTLFIFVSSNSQTFINGFNNEQACEKTKKEVIMRLRPQKIACIPLDFGEPEKK